MVVGASAGAGAGVGAASPGTGPAGRDDESEPEPEHEPEPRPGPNRDWDCGCAAAAPPAAAGAGAGHAGLGDAPSRFSLGPVGFDVMPVLRPGGASAAALARLARVPVVPVPVLVLALPLIFPVAVVLASLALPLNSVLNIANRVGCGPQRCPRRLCLNAMMRRGRWRWRWRRCGSGHDGGGDRCENDPWAKRKTAL